MHEFELILQQLRFRICQWGKDSDPPILLLHGWLDQAASWLQTAEVLASYGYRVLAMDQRGHGCTAHIAASAHYHFPDYISDVAFLQQALQLSDMTVIGHSMGGTVAAQYAALQPQHVRQLILIEGMGPPHETPKMALRRYRDHLHQRMQPCFHQPMPSIKDAAQKLQRYHPYIADELALFLAERVTKKQQNQQYMWRWDPRHRKRSATGFDATRHIQLLSHIEAPTVLIWGEQSPFHKLADLPQRIAALAHLHSQHYLPGGHSPHYEHPQQLADLLVRIVQGI